MEYMAMIFSHLLIPMVSLAPIWLATNGNSMVASWWFYGFLCLFYLISLINPWIKLNWKSLTISYLEPFSAQLEFLGLSRNWKSSCLTNDTCLSSTCIGTDSGLLSKLSFRFYSTILSEGLSKFDIRHHFSTVICAQQPAHYDTFFPEAQGFFVV